MKKRLTLSLSLKFFLLFSFFGILSIFLAEVVETNTQISHIAIKFFCLVFLAIIMFMFIHIIFSKPMNNLKESLEYISDGNYDLKLDISSNDEFGEIAETFERMRQKIKESQEILFREVNSKTRKLRRKIDDLEKIKELTTDSEIYAEEIRKERDILLEENKRLNARLIDMKKDNGQNRSKSKTK